MADYPMEAIPGSCTPSDTECDEKPLPLLVQGSPLHHRVRFYAAMIVAGAALFLVGVSLLRGASVSELRGTSSANATASAPGVGRTSEHNLVRGITSLQEAYDGYHGGAQYAGERCHYDEQCHYDHMCIYVRQCLFGICGHKGTPFQKVCY